MTRDEREVRLRRILAMVPVVRARPGIRVDELAKLLACTPAELREDVDLLGLVGSPPFEPDDLIDISIRGDRVYVSLSHAFDRPSRLTASEAAALTLAARALAPDDPVLKTALQKLAEAVAPSQRDLYAALVARVPPTGAADEELARTLEEAARDRHEVELDYFDPSATAASTRIVRPRGLAAVDGVTYLSAQKPNGDERLYRLERIVRATRLETTFSSLPPLNVERELQRLARIDARTDVPRATVRFSAQVAEAAKRRHPSARALADGSLEASVAYLGLPWLVSYALSWGGEAEIVAPAEAREALRDAVRRALANHPE